MANIEKIEDMLVWQNAIKLCNKIYDVTDKPAFSKEYALKDQIRRSAISVPSNIAEGFERESNRQFIYFLLIVKGSNGEFKTQLHITNHRKYISAEEFTYLSESSNIISKQLGKFISYLRESIKKTSLKKSQTVNSNKGVVISKNQKDNI